MSKPTRMFLIESNNKLQAEISRLSREVSDARKDLHNVLINRDKAERLVDRLLKVLEDGVKESNFPRRAIP